MPTLRSPALSAALAALAALLALAAAPAPASAQQNKDNRAEKIQKLENYTRAYNAKQTELTELTAQQQKAEAEAHAAQATYDEATEKIQTLNQEAGEARRAAADAGRTMQELDKQLRDKVDESPDVAAAAERFRKTDTARQRIEETITAPIKATDEYKELERKLAALTEKRELYVKSDSVDPQEVASLMAQERSVEMDMKQMLNEALTASEEYRAARAAADAATRELGALRDQHAAKVAADPALAAARDAMSAAKDLVVEKSKQLAEARKDQAEARTLGKRASVIYANATGQVNKLQTELKQLEAGINKLRRDLD